VIFLIREIICYKYFFLYSPIPPKNNFKEVNFISGNSFLKVMPDTILYRGYVGKPSDNGNVLNSGIDIAVELAKDPRLNPTDPKYAGKLLWATRVFKTAEHVAIARFITMSAIDELTMAGIREEMLKQRVVEYTFHSYDGLYNVLGGGHNHSNRHGICPATGGLNAETIIQKAEEAKFYEPTSESFDKFLGYLFTPGHNCEDAAKLLTNISRLYGGEFKVDESMGALTLVDVIRLGIQHYISSTALSEERAPELVAGSIDSNMYSIEIPKLEMRVV
jgi:hypothetical protein